MEYNKINNLLGSESENLSRLINDCKLYIPVATLSKDDEIKLLTNLKSGFTREIKWNKHR